MSKSILTIHKEIERKEWEKTPLGQLEKNIRQFYNRMSKNGKRLPEEVAKKVYEIRTENEKIQLEYIERTNREHKEFIDQSLLKSMGEEWELIKEYND